MKQTINTNIVSILIGASWLLTLMNSMLFLDSLMYIIFISVIIAYGLSKTNEQTHFLKSEISKKMLTFIFLFWFSAIISSFVLGKTEIFNFTILRLLIIGALTGCILCCMQVNIKILKIFYYAVIIYLTMLIVFQQIDASSIFVHSSGAMVSGMLLPLTITILYLDYRDSCKISVLPAIAITLLSMNTTSRTGAICCILLFCLTTLFSIRTVQSKGLRYFLFFIVCGFVVWYVVRSLPRFAEMEIYQKFDAKGVDIEDRSLIWEAYFKDNTFLNWIFGVNTSGRHILRDFPNNMHNSFLNLHRQVGILCVVIIYYIVKALTFQVKNNLFFAGLFIIFILYGFFNAAFFFTAFDFAIYVFILDLVLLKPADNLVKQIKVSIV